MDSLIYGATAWLGTFALHSTVVVVLAFAALRVSRRLFRRDDRFEEVFLRVSMFGAAITTSAQRYLGHAALQGLEFDLGVAAPPGTTAMALAESAVPSPALDVAAGTVSIAPVVATPWPMILGFSIAIYGFVVLLVAAWRLRGCVRFRRLLVGRAPVHDPDVLRACTELHRRSGISRPVRLSVSDRLDSPVAFGWFRPEICLPTAVLDRMDGSGKRCVLAHEMAHLRHGDPRWLLFYELWSCLFFFQPLFGVTRRRLRELAEFRCDAWVVDQTGDRVGMARALVEVAEWIAGREPVSHVLAPAMAVGDSSLASRVRRILEPAISVRRRRRWLTTPAICSVLAGLSFGAPGVRLDSGEPAAPIATRDQRPIRAQLVALERDIAGLHGQLAKTWLLLEGRDLPRVTAALRSMQHRLQQMTEERAALWRQAMPRVPAAEHLHRARWKSDDSVTNPMERVK